MARSFLLGYTNDGGSPGSPIYGDKPTGNYDPYTFEVDGKTYVAKPDYQDPTMADGLSRGYGIKSTDLATDPETGQVGLLQSQQTRLDDLMTSRQSEDFIGSLGPLSVLVPLAFAVAGNFAFGADAVAPAAGTTTGVAGTDFGVTVPFSQGSTASFSAAQQAAGLSAAQAAGAEVGATSFTAAQQAAALAAAGGAAGATTGGLVSNAMTGPSEATAGAPVAADTAAGVNPATGTVLSESDQAIIDQVNQWVSDTGFQSEFGNAGEVANVADASMPSTATGNTITSAATETPPPTGTEKAISQSTGVAQNPAEALGTPAQLPPITDAQAAAGGPQRTSFIDSILDWGNENPKLASAIVTGGLQVAGGIGAASLAQSTMENKAELDLQNQQALKQFLIGQSSANAYRGGPTVRPAATIGPLQRLTGGSVYGTGGIINSARRV